MSVNMANVFEEMKRIIPAMSHADFLHLYRKAVMDCSDEQSYSVEENEMAPITVSVEDVNMLVEFDALEVGQVFSYQGERCIRMKVSQFESYNFTSCATERDLSHFLCTPHEAELIVRRTDTPDGV